MKQPAPLDRNVVLSPAWLSEALATRHPGAVVKSVEIVETIQTQATKIRFRVEYADGLADIPRDFCVKGLLGPESERLLAAGISEIETRFYQEIAGGLSIQTPPLAYGGVDPETRHGLIIMEDVIAAGGAFLTALTPYSIAQTEATLSQLAALHAACWHGRRIERFSWLPSRLPAIAAKPLVPLERQQELLDDPRGESLSATLRSAQGLFDIMKQLAAHSAATPPCLVHGDSHAGNLYENARGPGIVDWQMLQLGHWAMDVAYHVGSVLTVEARGASEQALLRHYLERLRANGVQPPAWDDAWREYRAHMVYGFYMWACTRLVEPRITYEFVRRLGVAVTELDSYGLLEKAA